MSRDTLREVNKWNKLSFMPREEEPAFIDMDSEKPASERKRKKDTLQVVNKFNKAAFVPDTKDENLFLLGGGQTNNNANIAKWDRLASQAFGADYGDSGFTLDDYMSGTTKAQGNNSWLGLSKANNPFSKGNIGSTMTGIASAAAPMVGNFANSAISGGLSSGAGSAISGIGSTVGSAVGAVNPLLGAAVTVGSGILGGVTNALFGEGVDEKKLQAAKEGTAQLNSFTSNAGSFDDIKGPQAVASVQDVYKGGVFTSGSARRKNEELKKARAEARMFADRSILNNVNNLASDQLNDTLANYAAFGGPLDTMGSNDMGAIGYNFMTDYLTAKKRQTEQRDKMISPFANVPSALFAEGGEIHIKHPGRLTALKERTGKTEAELWAEGRPEVRKMITFARNSRKWKHADGGPLNVLNDDTPLFAFGGNIGGKNYSVGQVLDIDESEIQALIDAGYEVKYL